MKEAHQTGTRDIKRVAYDGKRTTVRWEIHRVDGLDEYEMTCVDKPEAKFTAALHALRDQIAVICELEPEYCGDLEVRGASFSYGGEDRVMGATITAMKHVTTADAPFVINTPHLPSEPYSADDPSEPKLLDQETVEALRELQKQALRYIDGHRSQGDLFVKADEDKPKKAKKE